MTTSIPLTSQVPLPPCRSQEAPSSQPHLQRSGRNHQRGVRMLPQKNWEWISWDFLQYRPNPIFFPWSRSAAVLPLPAFDHDGAADYGDHLHGVLNILQRCVERLHHFYFLHSRYLQPSLSGQQDLQIDLLVRAKLSLAGLRYRSYLIFSLFPLSG